MTGSSLPQQSERAKRWVVWLCAGCQDCEPARVEDKSSMPCRDSPSMNGGVVVLAEDYEKLEAEAERLRAAIDDALSTTWVKDDDGAWGTDEDVVHPDRLTALAALQPHWQAWGDQAWDIAGRAEDRLRRVDAATGKQTRDA